MSRVSGIRELVIELGHLEGGTDTDMAMELELLGAGAEPLGERAMGEAFAAEAIDVAPCFHASDDGAVGERGRDGEDASRRGRADAALQAGADATDEGDGDAGELGGASIANPERGELRQMGASWSGVEERGGHRAMGRDVGRVGRTARQAAATALIRRA
jgi:hypothetical protein